MFFILNRDLELASTSGHAVSFKKDQPTFVPPPMWKEVKALGAEPTEEIPEDLKEPVSKVPEDQDERDKEIRAAIEALTLKNQREDFGAGGKVNLKPLSDFVGWTVSAKERDRVLAQIAAGE
jgi:hypothetical protein